MYTSPTDPRDSPDPKQPTWRHVLASYALVAAVAASLWVLSNPVAGAVVLAATAGLTFVGRRAARLVRCFRDCGEFALDPAESVRSTVTKTAPDTDLSDESTLGSAQAPNCC